MVEWALFILAVVSFVVVYTLFLETRKMHRRSEEAIRRARINGLEEARQVCLAERDKWESEEVRKDGPDDYPTYPIRKATNVSFIVISEGLAEKIRRLEK